MIAMRTTRNLLIVALLCVNIHALAQETYTVTRVKGGAVNARTGTSVKTGDVLQSDDKLTFENFDSYLISINQNMGRFMIRLHEPQALDEASKFTAYVRDIATPTKRRSLMAERYNPNQTTIGDLRAYFGASKFSIIGNTIQIPVDTKTYTINEDKFVVFSYRVNNNPVTKKLGYQNDTLVVEKDKLVVTKSGNITTDEIPSLSVYLYEGSTRSAEQITKIDLMFVEQQVLINEFNTIIPILNRQKMGKDDIKKYLIEYYYDFYGATDSKSIKEFVDRVVDNYKG